METSFTPTFRKGDKLFYTGRPDGRQYDNISTTALDDSYLDTNHQTEYVQTSMSSPWDINVIFLSKDNT